MKKIIFLLLLSLLLPVNLLATNIDLGGIWKKTKTCLLVETTEPPKVTNTFFVSIEEWITNLFVTIRR